MRIPIRKEIWIKAICLKWEISSCCSFCIKKLKNASYKKNTEIIIKIINRVLGLIDKTLSRTAITKKVENTQMNE
jgi:hypothetical protein